MDFNQQLRPTIVVFLLVCIVKEMLSIGNQNYAKTVIISMSIVVNDVFAESKRSLSQPSTSGRDDIIHASAK